MAYDKPSKPEPPSRKGDSTPSGHFIEEQGKAYWSNSGTTKGKVSGIPWGTPGDYQTCLDRTAPHLGEKAHGYCANMHKKATGFWPGRAPGESK